MTEHGLYLPIEQGGATPALLCPQCADGASPCACAGGSPAVSALLPFAAPGQPLADDFDLQIEVTVPLTMAGTQKGGKENPDTFGSFFSLCYSCGGSCTFCYTCPFTCGSCAITCPWCGTAPYCDTVPWCGGTLPPC